MDWIAEARKFQLTAREGDRVMVDAPANSMASEYYGLNGFIDSFDIGAGWIQANIDGLVLRLRADELKIL